MGILHRLIPRFLRILVLLLVVAAVGLAAFLYTFGQKPSATFAEDAAIVLGCELRGEKPSQTLTARLDKAVLYHAKNPDAWIVVSGGKNGSQTVSEASAMRAYLIEQGVAEDQILVEDQATTTRENMVFSKSLLDAKLQGDYTVCCITSDFHAYRATGFAKKAGLTATLYCSPQSWYLFPTTYLQEDLGVARMWILGT